MFSSQYFNIARVSRNKNIILYDIPLITSKKMKIQYYLIYSKFTQLFPNFFFCSPGPNKKFTYCICFSFFKLFIYSTSLAFVFHDTDSFLKSSGQLSYRMSHILDLCNFFILTFRLNTFSESIAMLLTAAH